MEKTIVIYKSKYGSTKQYAEWIAQELGCDAKSIKDVKPKELAGYTVIYGGGLYAGGVSGAKFVRRHSGEWKNTVVYMVGAAPVDAEEILEQYKIRNFSEVASGSIFYMQGDLDYAKMNGLHRMMMNMLRRMVSKKPTEERTEMENGVLESIGQTVRNVDKSMIAPLVEYVKSFS